MTDRPKADIPELKTHEHLVAALPIALVVVGGLLGGAIGGIAYGINTSVFRKDISTARKYSYAVLVTLASCAAYLGIGILLALLFPSVIRK